MPAVPSPGFPVAMLLAGSASAALAAMEALSHSGPHPVLAPAVRNYGLAFAPAFWDAVGLAGYGAYAAPFMAGLDQGGRRRLAAGFGALLASTCVVMAAGSGGAPGCLHLAVLVFAVFVGVSRAGATSRSALWVSAALAAGGGAAFMARGHDVGEVLAGAALGAGAWAFGFGAHMRFLESERPWDRMLFEAKNLFAILTGRAAASWDADFAAGRWDFLDSPAQRARHHAIAGLISDRYPSGARVLDVGCGLGTLFSALRGGRYHGVDVSPRAVAACRKRFGGAAGASFSVGDVLHSFPQGRYDVVVLNELLYYFPSAVALRLFRRALEAAAPGGTVIVSMNRSIKSRLLWKRLSEETEPEESLRVVNLETGSYWTLKCFRRVAAPSRGEPVREAPSRSAQAVTAVAMAAAFGAGFYVTGWHMAGAVEAGRTVWAPVIPADSAIPFVPALGWVYVLYFPFCLLPLAFARVRDDAREFRRVALGLSLQFGVAFAAFWFVPTRTLRPELPEGGWLTAPLAAIFAADPGFNALPSLHVANVCFVALVVRRHAGGAAGAASAVLAAAIAASTLFVKQHYLADVAAGAALGWAAFRWAFRRDSTRGEVDA